MTFISNFLKNRDPPVVMAPTSEFYKRIIKRGEDFYYKHSWLTIAGVLVAGYLIFGYSFKKDIPSSLTTKLASVKTKKASPPYNMRYKIVIPNNIYKASI